jgi:hypothetical protein
MFLTITSIIVAACFGIAFTIACQLSNQNDRLRCKIKELRHEAGMAKSSANEMNEMFENLADANESHDVSYFVGYDEVGSTTVLRRSFSSDGREYHTFIKCFTDEDTEFNQREAEELCEILNSK